jgi:DNA-binding NtrC family response regulator
MKRAVLVVAQDGTMAMDLCQILSHGGYHVVVADGAGTALQQLQQELFDVVVTEEALLRTNGQVSHHDEVDRLLRMSTILIVPEDTPVKHLNEIVRKQSVQIVVKPFNAHEILDSVQRAISTRRPMNPYPGRLPSRRIPRIMSNIITRNPEFEAVLEIATKAAWTDATVLITGETGTGKELLAQEIHRISPRANRPFVVVNCAALPETLLEAELFGYARGAFTGADRAKAGFFEVADGGTIFLDEIGDVSETFQLKLLRILQQGEYNRLGDPHACRTNMRVLAATNKDLERAVREQRFREDLFYRLNVFHLQLPPLRQRKEDIPLLAYAFLYNLTSKMCKSATEIALEVVELLQAYDWPGNIRELQNLIERAVILCDGQLIERQHLPERLQKLEAVSRQDLNVPFKVAKERFVGDFERRYIIHHLMRNQGNVAQTARTTGMFEAHLYQKIKRYQINPKDFRRMSTVVSSQ